MQTTLNKILKNNSLTLLYITNPTNIKYLTGFDASFSILLIQKNKLTLITDDRYLEEASKLKPPSPLLGEGGWGVRAPIIEVLNIKSPDYKKILNNSKRTGFIESQTTVTQLKTLKKKYKTKWIPLPPLIEELRAIKTKQEIKHIKKACVIANKALKLTLPKIKTNITELELAWQLEKTARELGAESLAFPTIVAFEKNSAIPHHKTGNTKLKKGNVILIDFGVKYQGYCSDMTRTFFFKEINEEKKHIYNHVKQAQLIGIQHLKANKNISTAHKEVVKYFKQHKLEKYFTHSLGHGVGLDIHESPNISEKTKGKLKTGNIVTCEPGIYLPGKFGIRIEDLVIITPTNFQTLTKTPKSLKILS